MIILRRIFDSTNAIMNDLYSLSSLIESIGTDRLTVGLQEFAPGIYTQVTTIAQTIITPIALSFLALYALLELISISNKIGPGNVGWELMAGWAIKFGLGYIMVTQSLTLLTALFDIGLTFVGGVSAANIGGDLLDYASMRDVISEMNLGEQLSLQASVLLVTFIMRLGSIFINIKITMRMLEIYAYIALAPIPLSTIAGGESSQMAKSFLKNFAAAVIQGVLIMLFLSMASGMYLTLMPGVTDDFVGAIWGMAGFMIMLIMAIVASETTAKKVIGVM